MFNISTKSQYGLRAMVYLARRYKNICPLEEISKKENISFDYLEKIISRLKKAGLIEAKKGSRGGYFLARHPSKIRIKEIILALENKKSLVKCIAKDKHYYCSLEKRCLTKNFWQKIQKSIEQTLDSVTLADLICQKK